MTKDGRRVLVVEDDADSRTLFGEVLTDADLVPVCVDHGSLPPQDGFSAIVSDLPTPRDGYSSVEARGWASMLQRRYHAPLIVITGQSEAMHDAELRRSTAHVLAKPIDIDTLVATVRTADRRRWAR